MDRREFLLLAGAAAGLTAAALGAETDEVGESLVPGALLAMLGPDIVRRIGESYREATPAERDATSLRAALREARRATTADRVRDDFATGRTVVAHGWVLAVTEARQCALWSLPTP